MAISCKHVRDLASGFVLGALEPDEMNAVRDHLVTCEKDHTEFDDLGGVVSYLATTVEPMEPPAWLRESVVAAAEADLRARHRTHRADTTSSAALIAQISPAAAAEIIPFGQPAGRHGRRLRDRRPPTWLTRVAAAIALFALIGYSAIVQAGLYNPHATTSQGGQIWGYAGLPDSHSVVLTSTGDTSASGVLVLRPNGHVLCQVYGLPATSGDQAYVVWLSVDGSPLTKAGIMPIDANGSGFLEYDEGFPSSTLRVAITREARADVSKPHGPVVVGGTISVFQANPAALPF